MLIIGLLLVVLSAAAVTLLVAYNSSGGNEQTIVLFGRDWINVSMLEAFLAGIGLTLLFSLGVWMIVATERQRRTVRSEFRAVRRDARTATRERDDLAKQLEQERSTTPVVTRDPEPEPGRHATTTTTTPAQEEVASTPESEPRRGFGRHFRRTHRTAETPAERADSR